MVSLAFCKKVLEENGRKYSNEMVKVLRDLLYTLAEIEYKNYQENFLSWEKKQ